MGTVIVALLALAAGYAAGSPRTRAPRPCWSDWA